MDFKLSVKMLLILLLILLQGCSKLQEEENIEQPEKIEPESIARYEGKMSNGLPFVYTTKKELSLTFNGMADEETMKKLMFELDKNNIKATFFLPGMRVAEEPEIARMILERGHEIENNTLNLSDLKDLPYEVIFKEIQLANKVIEEKTGVTPKYIRTKSGDFNDDIRLAAAHVGLNAVISYSVNPKDWDMKSAEDIASYIKKYITRGGIINLNTHINPEVIPAISLISKAVAEVGYQLVTLDQLIEGGGEKKSLNEIVGHDAAKINLKYRDVSYHSISQLDSNKKHIALTFDDWGTDQKITEILNILNNEDVKATFFLRANGVEANPNLARAIVEEGHDVANHTYSHPVITKLNPDELQNEIVKAHQVLTEAIQQQPVMLFRPPTGAVDEQTARIVAATGYKTITLYDVTAYDWDIKNDSTKIVNSVLQQTKNGSIILLHLQDEIHTSKALPILITELKQRGFTFVKIADVMGN